MCWLPPSSLQPCASAASVARRLEAHTKVALKVMHEHEPGPEREKKITALINEGTITKGAFFKAVQINGGAPSVALPLCRTHTSLASPRHPHAAIVPPCTANRRDGGIQGQAGQGPEGR